MDEVLSVGRREGVVCRGGYDMLGIEHGGGSGY